MRFGFAIYAFFIILTSNAQSPDVRKTNWGASSAEVKKAEQPLVPSFEKDSDFISQKQANKIISYSNVIVQKHNAQIDYFFRNDKLVAICFTLFQLKDSVSIKLYTKLIQTQGIFNQLVQDKAMKPLYCWTYDNESFKQQSGKVACSFADKATAEELEKYGTGLNYVNKALFVLENDRSLASFEFDIKNIEKNILCWINFSPTGTVEQSLKSNDF